MLDIIEFILKEIERLPKKSAIDLFNNTFKDTHDKSLTIYNNLPELIQKAGLTDNLLLACVNDKLVDITEPVQYHRGAVRNVNVFEEIRRKSKDVLGYLHRNPSYCANLGIPKPPFAPFFGYYECLAYVRKIINEIPKECYKEHWGYKISNVVDLKSNDTIEMIARRMYHKNVGFLQALQDTTGLGENLIRGFFNVNFRFQFF